MDISTVALLLARTFCITSPKHTVYEYTDRGNDINVILDDVYTTSGIAFDEDAKKLYHAGSSLYKVTGLGVRGPKATSFILEQETETT